LQVTAKEPVLNNNIEEFKQFIRGVVIPNLNTHGANSPVRRNDEIQKSVKHGIKQSSIGSAKELPNKNGLY